VLSSDGGPRYRRSDQCGSRRGGTARRGPGGDDGGGTIARSGVRGHYSGTSIGGGGNNRTGVVTRPAHGFRRRRPLLVQVILNVLYVRKDASLIHICRI
jgi:hypothetical protein